MSSLAKLRSILKVCFVGRAMVLSSKKTTMENIVFRAPEIVDPLNLAIEQIRKIREWVDSSASVKGLYTEEFIHSMVANFHPDKKYDSVSRALNPLQLSPAWLAWESLKFEPDDMPQTTRRVFMDSAEFKGLDLWPWGPVNFRVLAVHATVSLCEQEYTELKAICDAGGAGKSTKSSLQNINLAEAWRHLYWFTRFFRAWQRMIKFPPKQEEPARKKVAWRRAAWAYFLSLQEKGTKKSLNGIAISFVKQYEPGGTNSKDVHEWLTKRLNKFLGTTPPPKYKFGIIEACSISMVSSRCKYIHKRP